MQKIKSFLVVFLVAALAACSPKYSQPVIESHPSTDGKVSVRYSGATTDETAVPLIIMDGKIISNDDLLNVNPNDIVSISVFKDAAAIAKFGEKAKNGVIRITTNTKK